MKPNRKKTRLQLLPIERYVGVDEKDPIKFYHLPVIGRMYQQRIELCLDQLAGGQSVLEVGFGSGVSFLNLSQLYREIHGIDLTADTRHVGEMFAALAFRPNYATAASWRCLTPTELRRCAAHQHPGASTAPGAASGIPGDLAGAQAWRTGGLRRARGAAMMVFMFACWHRYPPAPLLH